MIPKIIHFAWHCAELPDWAERNVQQFRDLNPGYDVRVHLVADIGGPYADIIAQTDGHDGQTNLGRLALLKEYGGWWFDVDYWPIRPVDDIVADHSLDGSTLFITQQHHMKNPECRIANGILAASPEWSGWSMLGQAINNMDPPFTRITHGPVLFTDLIDSAPEYFTVGSWPGFYPLGIDDAKDAYRAMLDGDVLDHWLDDAVSRLGAMPYVMHLWSAGTGLVDPVSVSGDKLSASGGKQ